MLARMAAFEWRYQVRSPVFWVGCAMFFLLTFGAATVDQIQIGARGNVNINSPFNILQVQLIMGMFANFVTVAMVAGAVLRDDGYHLLREQNRPVSTYEIVSAGGFSWAQHISAHEAAQILREDARFKDLGRFLFALASWDMSERETIKDLIVKILEAAGTPLESPEIGLRVRRFRSVGLSSFRHILRQHELVQGYGVGFYGLKSWGRFTDFFVTHKKFLKRLLPEQPQPLTFGALCARLNISYESDLAHTLWRTLHSFSGLRFTPAYCAPTTVITLAKRIRDA